MTQGKGIYMLPGHVIFGRTIPGCVQGFGCQSYSTVSIVWAKWEKTLRTRLICSSKSFGTASRNSKSRVRNRYFIDATTIVVPSSCVGHILGAMRHDHVQQLRIYGTLQRSCSGISGSLRRAASWAASVIWNHKSKYKVIAVLRWGSLTKGAPLPPCMGLGAL